LVSNSGAKVLADNIAALLCLAAAPDAPPLQPAQCQRTHAGAVLFAAALIAGIEVDRSGQEPKTEGGIPAASVARSSQATPGRRQPSRHP
jgi:hypothetical protein